MKKKNSKITNYLNGLIVILSVIALIANLKNGLGGGIVVYLLLASAAIFLNTFFTHWVLSLATHALNLLLLYTLFVDVLKLKMLSLALFNNESDLIILAMIIIGGILTFTSKKFHMWSILWLCLHIMVISETAINHQWQAFWSNLTVVPAAQKYFSLIFMILLIGILVNSQEKFQKQSS